MGIDNRLFAAALIAAVLVTTPAFSDQIIIGMGATTCADYVQDYYDGPSNADDVYGAWSFGFMSGWNVALSQAKRKTVDLGVWSSDKEQNYILSYCEANQQTSYVFAVRDLYMTLAKAQKIKP